jgi:hypothetical protein
MPKKRKAPEKETAGPAIPLKLRELGTKKKKGGVDLPVLPLRPRREGNPTGRE